MQERAPGYEYMSFDDFEELLLDKPEHARWELIGGRVVRGMVGARWEHQRIVQNVTTTMMNRFRASGSSCRPFAETFHLKDRSIELNALPDVMVRCGKLEAGETELSDPIVIVEVLSAGTEARDWGEKWRRYQKLPSLRHYVLVQRERPYVEAIHRAEVGWSGFDVLEGLNAVLRLPAVDFEISLTEVYADVFEV